MLFGVSYGSWWEKIGITHVFVFDIFNANEVFSVYLICNNLGSGRKLENLAGRTCKLDTERPKKSNWSWDLNWQPFDYQCSAYANHWATTTQAYQWTKNHDTSSTLFFGVFRQPAGFSTIATDNCNVDASCQLIDFEWLWLADIVSLHFFFGRLQQAIMSPHTLRTTFQQCKNVSWCHSYSIKYFRSERKQRPALGGAGLRKANYILFW